MEKNRSAQTPAEWEESEDDSVQSSGPLFRLGEAAILNSNLGALAKKYDGFEITALVHKVAKKNKLVPIDWKNKPTKFQSIGTSPLREEPRTVNLPNLMTERTVYDNALCGSLLSEFHHYSHDNYSEYNSTKNSVEPIPTTETTNVDCVARPLYALHRDITKAQQPSSREVTNISTTITRNHCIENEIVFEEDLQHLEHSMLLENESETKTEANFAKYTAGLNRIPPLYSTSNFRKRRNCFNSLSKPGALPHISKNGVYYRFVNYDAKLPEMMSVTVTNPTLVKSFYRASHGEVFMEVDA
ncbi:uncharacterized protein [Rhodnius prolixus]|uniref:uncharacterized protein n=1 Tax=Rhodnius prolixus TaxID=13249 RepID=UPI003D18C017